MNCDSDAMTEREYYFANDLMHFIAKRYRLDWSPPVERHSSSPFKLLIEIEIKEYLHSEDDAIRREYHTDLQGRIFDPVQFKDFSIQRFIEAEVDLGKEEHILRLCTYVARLASLFYQNGLHGAPEAAVEAIKDVLVQFHRTYDKDIFEDFVGFGFNRWVEFIR